MRRLGLPFRDVDWTEWDDLLRRVHQPDARGHRRAGRQVHRPARRLPVGDRGAARRRLRQRLQGAASAGSPPTTARRPRVRRAQLERRRRGLHPGRLRRPRHRGQARRDPLRPREPDPDPRPVPRPAVHGHRVPPATWPASRAPTRRSSTRRPPHPVIATMADQARRRRRRARHGRHHAARALPGRRSREGSLVPRGLRRRPYVEERHRHRYEVNNAYRDAAGARPGWSSPAPRRTGGSSSTSSCRATCTRTSSPPRRTRSSGPARPGRTRCSPAWSPPRWPRQGAVAGRALDLGARRAPRDGGPHAGGRRRAGRRCTVRSSETVHDGMVWDVRRDEVDLGGRAAVTREVIDHTGAVGVVVLDDRGPGAAAAAVPAPGAAPTCGSRRPGCSTWRARTRWSRRSASSPRRPTWSPTTGTCWSTSSTPRAAAPRRSAATWPAGCHEVPERRAARARARGARHGAGLGAARRGPRPGARRAACTTRPRSAGSSPRRRAGRRLGDPAAGRRAVAGAVAAGQLRRAGLSSGREGRARRARAGPAARCASGRRPSSRRRLGPELGQPAQRLAGPAPAPRAGRRSRRTARRSRDAAEASTTRPAAAAARRAPGTAGSNPATRKPASVANRSHGVLVVLGLLRQVPAGRRPAP